MLIVAVGVALATLPAIAAASLDYQQEAAVSSAVPQPTTSLPQEDSQRAVRANSQPSADGKPTDGFSWKKHPGVRVGDVLRLELKARFEEGGRSSYAGAPELACADNPAKMCAFQLHRSRLGAPSPGCGSTSIGTPAGRSSSA